MNVLTSDISQGIPISRRSAVTLLSAAAAATPFTAAAAHDRERMTVFAAASLTDALEVVGRAYTARTMQPVRFSFAASSALARQLEAGARADLFVSADLDWMAYAQARGLIDPSTRRDLLRGRLALIAPRASAARLTIAPGFPLARALGRRGRLAVGDPEYVPAGRYARSALLSLGVWADVADRLAPADSVRAALAYVARGESPLGIVYETDARIEPAVRIVSLFPETSHPPIVYPVAITRRARPGARRLYGFVAGPEGGAIFRRYGFATPG